MLIMQQMRSDTALLEPENALPIQNPSTTAELISLDGLLKQVKDIMRQPSVNTLSKSRKKALLASLDELAERMPSLLNIDHPVESVIEEDVAVLFSIMWQILQSFLIGAAKVLTFIGQLEFFYDQSLDAICSLCNTSLLTTCLGSLTKLSLSHLPNTNVCFSFWVYIPRRELLECTIDWSCRHCNCHLHDKLSQ